jgi:uncharacterized protein
MHPQIEVTVDGNAVAGGFYERLISCTVTDKEGVISDTFSIDLNDGPPNFLSLPPTGAIVNIRVGYLKTGIRPLGRFKIDKVTPKCLPYSLSISGKSADLGKGDHKRRKERHWDNKKLGDIVSTIAGEMGLSARVDPAIANYVYPWIGQQDESNVSLLRRLEERHNALFAVKSGQLVFVRRGSGLASAGSPLGNVVVTPDIIVLGSCEFEANDRTKYSKVVSYWQDKNEVKRVEVSASTDEADAEAIYRITEPFASLEEADKAANSRAKALRRGEGTARVTVVGDPTIVAGAPLMFRGVRPGLDGRPFIIDTVTHTFDKSGFKTAISAKAYDGRSASGQGGAEVNGDTPVTVDKNGTPTPTPRPDGAGTPPSAWGDFQRNGLTDAN